MPDSSAPTGDVLKKLADGFGAVVPEADATAEHDRWKPGIDPFEEERQLAMLLNVFRDTHDLDCEIGAEVTYPDTGQRCDLVVTAGGYRIPIEAKLLRFRLDNGNIDSNCYMSVFSPFPEVGSSSCSPTSGNSPGRASTPRAACSASTTRKRTNPRRRWTPRKLLGSLHGTRTTVRHRCRGEADLRVLRAPAPAPQARSHYRLGDSGVIRLTGRTSAPAGLGRESTGNQFHFCCSSTSATF